MKIQFWGAVRNVTGTKHMLLIDDKKILLDCGLIQGPRKKTRERNLNFPFSPPTIHSVILSHGHIDHSGSIPTLVKFGFKGNIYSTFATKDLCTAVLRDSAHIQEKDAQWLRKKKKEAVEPIYTMDDADACLQYFVGVNYEKPFYLLKDVKCTFYDAGHILGSAQPLIEVNENGRNIKIIFTGDLGNLGNKIILKKPVIVNDIDYLIIESTYGNRKQADILGAKDELMNVVNETIKRKGKVIIPSFAVGRTQTMVFLLHKLFEENKISNIPIYIDSPLTVNVTEIFRNHPECLDKEVNQYLMNDEDPFGFGRLQYIRDVEKSKALNSMKEPCIIISASGMCEAGRILHHLKNNIEDERNSILIVGYQAEGTLGRRIVERQPEVRIFGESYKLKAQVATLNTLSAHADSDDLIEYIGKCKTDRLRKIFVVHGEESQSLPFAERIKQTFHIETIVPFEDEEFEL